MKSGFVPLAVLSLMVLEVPQALAAPYVPPAPVKMPVIKHGPFMLSEVYRVEPGEYESSGGGYGKSDDIAPNRCFNGTVQEEENVRVVPGILCLDTKPSDLTLNLASFATCPDGQMGEPYVQSFRLIKKVPGSEKAPQCYGSPKYPPTYYQFGSKGVRTWWALKYTQPGTTFILELTVRCHKLTGSRLTPVMHIDQWIWTVGVTPETLPDVIDMLHSTPLSVLEIPCIADEGVFRELKYLAKEFRDLVEEGASLYKKQEAFFALEGFIFQQCLYADWCFPSYLDPENPYGFDMSKVPGNLPTTSPGAYSDQTGDWCPYSSDDDYGHGGSDGGIVDSFEDPCCCKLIADVEYLGKYYKVTTPHAAR